MKLAAFTDEDFADLLDFLKEYIHLQGTNTATRNYAVEIYAWLRHHAYDLKGRSQHFDIHDIEGAMVLRENRSRQIRRYITPTHPDDIFRAKDSIRKRRAAELGADRMSTRYKDVEADSSMEPSNGGTEGTKTTVHPTSRKYFKWGTFRKRR